VLPPPPFFFFFFVALDLPSTDGNNVRALTQFCFPCPLARSNRVRFSFRCSRASMFCVPPGRSFNFFSVDRARSVPAPLKQFGQSPAHHFSFAFSVHRDSVLFVFGSAPIRPFTPPPSSWCRGNLAYSPERDTAPIPSFSPVPYFMQTPLPFSLFLFRISFFSFFPVANSRMRFFPFDRHPDGGPMSPGIVRVFRFLPFFLLAPPMLARFGVERVFPRPNLVFFFFVAQCTSFFIRSASPPFFLCEH